MYSSKHIQDSINTVDYLELKNSDNSSYAKIDLILGGSLQELKFLDKTIISNNNMQLYHEAYMSSILFPFANRIENGTYNFNDKTFELHKNESSGHNAIHGLVHDKVYQLIEQDISEKYASVLVSYTETNPDSGFPFKYSISLKYILSNDALELKVKIENKDQNAFPFSLGWHPYFKTEDLQNTYLKIKSSKKLRVNDKMIPIGEENHDWNGFVKIEDKAFDDCFVLNSNNAELKTTEYQLEFHFSTDENYLQIYTPNDRKSIAIEPQTAPANSFNSKIGLQVLKPEETYNLNWKIDLK